MAGKPKRMSQIKQLIRLHQQGYAIKSIARNLEVSKNTVKSYLSKINQAGLDMNKLLELEDPELLGLLHSGNPAYRDPRFEHLKEQLSYYEKELRRTGVTRKLLWEEYQLSNSGGYGYSQFCFHLQQLMVGSRKSSMIMDHLAGDKLYIDFSGKKLHYIDCDTGELVYCEVFVACLPYSNYCFAKAVASQRIPDFLDALDSCIQFLGGVPKALVPDNLKSAVIKSDRYEPEINKCMEDFANHYGTVVVPTRAAKPKDKSAVENHVRIVYTQVFARLRNVKFFDLASLNAAVAGCVQKLNQTRMQNRDYCRQERFISSEKSLLSPLPEERFTLKYYAALKIAENGHIFLKRDRHSYSVPHVHIGKKAQVVYTNNTLHIYVENKQVAVHKRSLKANAYSTNEEHLASKYREYKQRSPDYYIRRAEQLSSDLHALVKMIFAQKNRYPEQLYRTCDGLFRLHRTYGELFNRACQIAIENNILSYKFMQNMLQSGMVDWKDNETSQSQPLPNHNNIRGSNYYL